MNFAELSTVLYFLTHQVSLDKEKSQVEFHPTRCIRTFDWPISRRHLINWFDSRWFQLKVGMKEKSTELKYFKSLTRLV